MKPFGNAIEDGRYRYFLLRRWTTGNAVLFIMLNPSTADATRDDPTIRKCIGFAQRWQYPTLEVVNLFAYRATDPAELIKARAAGVDVIGLWNDNHIRAAAKRAGRIIAAWGRPRTKWIEERALKVEKLITGRPAPLECLGITQDGDPRHPLYVSYRQQPTEYKTA